MYEFVVKSGNHYGLSIFTDPLVISPSSLSNARSSTSNLATQMLRVVMAVSFIALLVILVGGVVLYAFRTRLPLNYSISRLINRHGLTTSSASSSPSTPSSSRGVSFENPSYMKDTQGHPTVQFKNGNNVHSHEGTNGSLGLMEVNANYDASAPKITLISP